MNNRKILQYCLMVFAFFVGLLVVNKPVFATSSDNYSTPSDTLTATSIPNLSGTKPTFESVEPKMPVLPVDPKLRDAGVTDSYLDSYKNSSGPQDLILTSDGQGGYTATVYTAKGFLEAIFDPASSGTLSSTQIDNPDSLTTLDQLNSAGYSMNCYDKGGPNGPNGWKHYLTANGGSNLFGQLHNTQHTTAVSKIHKILLKNNIDLTTLDANTAADYQINISVPDSNGIMNAPGYDWNNVCIRHDNLDIDGENHILNMGFNDLALRGSTFYKPENSKLPYKEDWTLENMNTYGTSYWGIVSCNTGISANRIIAQTGKDPDTGNKVIDPKTGKYVVPGKNSYADGLYGGYTWITYKNINYTGSQFSWTSNQHVAGATISGTVNAQCVYYYADPLRPNTYWPTEGPGNQQVFEEDRIEFAPDCRFTGSTYNGDALELTGTATLDDGAVVNLYPHGTSAEHSNSDGINHGLYFTSDSPGKLLLKGASKLNIHCDDHDGNDLIQNDGTYKPGAFPSGGSIAHNAFPQPASAILMSNANSNITYQASNNGKSSPEINIDSDGPISKNSSLVHFAGGKVTLERGKFSIQSKNLSKVINGQSVGYNTMGWGNHTNGLMAIGDQASVDVKTGGDFSIAANDDDQPMCLLYAPGNLNVNIMNPKNVSLDLRGNKNVLGADGDSPGPTENSTLVSTNGKAKIKAYNTRISAWGDNTKPPGISNIGLADKKSTSKTVSIGMGDPTQPLANSNTKGVTVKNPLRAQEVILPFSGSGINFTAYLTDPNNNVIQAPKATTLDYLNAAMAQMNGKEFRYIRLSDLPGADLNLDADSQTSLPLQPNQRIINGKVQGDHWLNTNEPEKPEDAFTPHPPLLRVQVQRSDGTKIDLGTEVNKNAAQQKSNTNPTNTDVTEVTPSLLTRDNETGNLEVNTATGLGKKIDPTSNPQPHYLKDSDVTWDGGTWDQQNQDNHSFKYDLLKLIKQYNDAHPDKPLNLKSTDKILTSVVTNYQSSPISTTNINKLYLQPGAPKEYLIGDSITDMPVQYLANDDAASKITINGTIAKPGGGSPESFVQTITPIQHNTLTSTNLTLPADATSTSGDYTVTFNGKDDQQNSSQSDALQWTYHVSNLPRYSGNKNIVNKDQQPISQQKKIVSGLDYDLITKFAPKNPNLPSPGNAIKITKDATANPSESNYNLYSETITATYTDAQGSHSQSLPFSYDKVYHATDFWSDQASFPAGTTFAIKRKLSIPRNDPGTNIHINSDSLISIADDNKETTLATSNALNYNSSGSVVLTTTGVIDYGNQTLPLKRGSILKIDKNKSQNLSVKVTNNTTESQKINLTAQLNPELDDVFSNNLNYLSSNSYQPLAGEPVNVYSTDALAANNGKDITADWFHENDQIAGPELKFNSLPNVSTGTHKSQITWTLTVGP